MAKCVCCGKETSFGKQLSITRSHISKRTSRTVKPNLRTVKAIVDRKCKKSVSMFKMLTFWKNKKSCLIKNKKKE